ncbi:MAG TPA: cache domain-containing protein, partial [Synergistaceae bacterium]|nr:cache domain-containing protein [Synergistaceae bacterium]
MTQRDKTNSSPGAPPNRKDTRLFLRIFGNLVLPPLVIFLFFVIIGFGFLIPLLEETFTKQKYDLCRRMVESAVSNLQARHDEYLRGEHSLSLEETQKRAIDRLRKLRFGEDLKDYYWILDGRGYLIMHPYRQDFENRNPATIQGPGEELLKKLFSRMQNVVQEQEGGFL